MNRVLSAFAILLIVSSALAFRPTKGGTFCVSDYIGGPCYVIFGKTEINNGMPPILRYKYNNWDGTLASCSGGVCPTPVNLYNEL